ncbi:MAG: OmpA family protein [Candidatus Poribacteria bacterium]|nr:OmpA family protein [Candidatus Poribacteria bacterium]MDE0503977.1 OmpA family protein [Candidatus Poribacteria bacterium]
MQFYQLTSVLYLLIVCIVIVGCGGTVDSILLETSLQNAQSAVSDAQRLDAEIYAKNEITRAMKLLEDARSAQLAGKGAQSMELAYQAQMEAKISGVQARQSVLQTQIDQVKTEILDAIIQEKTHQVSTAQTHQAIAEELTRRALDGSDRAEKRANDAQAAAEEAKKAAQKSMRYHETQLAISEAKYVLGFAKEVGATVHAQGDYAEAENLIAQAAAMLQRDAFDDAARLAGQAEERAQSARLTSIKAADAVSAKKTKAFTTAKIAIAAAQEEIGRAESVFASVYAEDLFRRAASALEQANASLNAEQYSQALQTAEQAEELARQAYTAAEGIDSQRRAEEALEEQIAQAKDAIFKAEESIEGKRKTDVPHLASEMYERADALLADARTALSDERYESAINSATQSQDALGEAIDAAEQLKNVEDGIFEAAIAISSAEVEKNEDGILIRFSGNLFASGSAKLNAEFLPRLEQLAEVIKSLPDYNVRIEGHSDSSGSEKANLRLTEKRAAAFKKYLVDQCGVPDERLRTVGLGETAPISAENDNSGKSKNRRIDTIIITREQSGADNNRLGRP